MRKGLNLIDLKRYLLLYVLFCGIISCSDVQERQEPKNLLSEKQMVEIYTDMILLDAVKRTNPKNFKSYSLKASEHIYNKYGLDSTSLAENMNYYNLDFETNAEIYSKVSESVEKRKAYIDSVVHLRDSLKKLEKAKKLSPKDSATLKEKKKLKIKSTKSN